MASRTKPEGRATRQGTDGDTNAKAAAGTKGMKAAIEVTKTEMAELTGRRVDAVTAVERRDDAWRLTLELVELERIPASTSVMGSYDVVVDPGGHVLEYARTHRYYHNRADDTDST